MTLSAAQKAQRKAAGRRSGQVRGGRTDATPASDEAMAALAGSSSDEIEARMAKYRAAVGPVQGWTDAKTYEQVRAEIVRTEGAMLTLAEQRGRLVDRSQVREAARGMRDAIAKHLQPIPHQAAAAVPGLTADQRVEVAAAVRSAVDAALDAAHEGAKG